LSRPINCGRVGRDESGVGEAQPERQHDRNAEEQDQQEYGWRGEQPRFAFLDLVLVLH
jgi:hypothetical protein